MENVNNNDKQVKSKDETHRNEVTLAHSKEIADLKIQARNIFIILGIIIIISGILLAVRDNISISLIWTSIIAGILGSTSSSLISALKRKATGWETEDGKKHPADGGKEMFSQRMATFFLFRPTFGITGGLLIYFGMQANLYGDTGIDDHSKVIFWSLLSGLFVKSLIEKLKDLFDSLVGKK